MAPNPLFLTAMLCVLLLAGGATVRAQNSPQDYLAAHNAARAAVGVGPMTWSSAVAAYAQSYANQRKGDCNLVHSRGPYGENLFGGSGTGWTAGDAVRLWVDEKQFYDRNTNTCERGRVCLHYTQVVWRKSVNLGCARVECDNGAVFITCNYDPRGNIIGQPPY